jgi:predicted nucleic acid-binding protein
VYILDTNILNILFYPDSARQTVLRKLEAVDKDTVWLSVITVYEVILHGIIPELKGSLNSPREVRVFDTLIRLQQKLAEFQILPFTDTDYENFKSIYQSVKKAPMDCRNAASAVTRNWKVVTHNAKDFQRIHDACGVEVIDWSIAPPA